MKIFFLHLLLLTMNNALQLGTACDCTEFVTPSECTQSSCAWQTQNGTTGCVDLTPAEKCPYLSSQAQCESIEGCSWTNGGTCAAFTQCSDYSVTLASDCYRKGTGCIPGSTTSSGNTQCQSGTFTCSAITDPQLCYGLQQSDLKYCFWVSSQCKLFDVSMCSTLTDESICQTLGCQYQNSVCSPPKCVDITTQNLCTYVRANDINKQQLCSWTNGACSNAIDSSFLTSTTCYPNSGGTYTWNGYQCIACTGKVLTANNGTITTSGNTTNSTSSSSNIKISLSLFLSILLILQN